MAYCFLNSNLKNFSDFLFGRINNRPLHPCRLYFYPSIFPTTTQRKRPNSSWRTAWAILKYAATIPHDSDDLSSSSSAVVKTILPVKVYYEVLESISKQKAHSSWQDAIRIIQYMEDGNKEDNTEDNNNNNKKDGSNRNSNSNSNSNHDDSDTWYIPSPNYEIYQSVIEGTSKGGRKDSDDASVYWLSKMLQKFEQDVERQQTQKQEEETTTTITTTAAVAAEDTVTSQHNNSVLLTTRDRKLVRNSIQLVLSNLSKQRKWREALRLLDYMETKPHDIPITVVQYNTVLGCLAKAQQVGQCQRLLQRLQLKAKEQQETATAATAAAVLLVSNDEGTNESTSTIPTPTPTPIVLLRPDEISYNAVMGAFASSGRWKEALELLDDLCTQAPQQLITPNIYIYTNAMRACAKAGQTSRALHLLETVKQQGLPVDSYCYTAVIDACAKGKQWKQALHLFEEMEEQGIVPTQVTYR